jgi:hypothetical protein
MLRALIDTRTVWSTKRIALIRQPTAHELRATPRVNVAAVIGFARIALRKAMLLARGVARASFPTRFTRRLATRPTRASRRAQAIVDREHVIHLFAVVLNRATDVVRRWCERRGLGDDDASIVVHRDHLHLRGFTAAHCEESTREKRNVPALTFSNGMKREP